MVHDGEILIDKSSTGRERPWKTHKTNSQLLSESFQRLNKTRKAEAVDQCGSYLKFNVCPEGHEKHLKWANFCRVRLCPMCSWRRSLIIAGQLKEVAHEAVKIQPLRWLFLTMSIRNCYADDLQGNINHLMKSWDRFTKRTPFKNAVVGWFRGFEITRNSDIHSEWYDSFNPHFHATVAVRPSYFSHGTGYLKQEEWLQLWKQSTKVDYQPYFDVRVVKNKRNVEKEMKILESKGISISDDGTVSESQLSGSVIAEVAKYSTKSEDYLVYNKYKQRQKGDRVILIPDVKKGINEHKTDEVVLTLDSALSRRRLVAYGGLLKDVYEELKARGKVQDSEDDATDLVHVNDDTECKCSVCRSDMLEELYSWLPNLKNYVKREKE